MGNRTPSYRLHKSSGQAVVTINRRDFYLGKYGSPQSKRAYGRLIAEWAASSSTLILGIDKDSLTVKQLLAASLAYLRKRHGTGPESEYHRVKVAYAAMKTLYADLPATEFGPLEFMAVRHQLHGNDRSRQYINKLMRRVRALFRWGASESLVPVSIEQTLATIKALRPGETAASEALRVFPVSEEAIEATLEFLPQVLRDMIRLQMYSGCRPGEVCRLSPGMINRTGEVWIATLEQHKTAYRGKQRVLYFGPKSQMILRPYLLRGENDPCFSPAEAMSQRNAVRGENRSSPPNSGNRPGYSKRIREQRKAKRSPGKQYETGAYGKAIRYACEQVFPILEGTTAKEAKAHRIKHWWSPNQLLHLAAAQIRKEFGLDAAQVILGHSELTVTQVYAERDIEKGLTVAKAFG